MTNWVVFCFPLPNKVVQPSWLLWLMETLRQLDWTVALWLVIFGCLPFSPTWFWYRGKIVKSEDDMNQCNGNTFPLLRWWVYIKWRTCVGTQNQIAAPGLFLVHNSSLCILTQAAIGLCHFVDDRKILQDLLKPQQDIIVILKSPAPPNFVKFDYQSIKTTGILSITEHHIPRCCYTLKSH